MEGRFKVFAKHGFSDVTKADLLAAKSDLEARAPEGELSEEKREAVAGGGVTAWLGVLVAVIALALRA